MGLKVAFVAAVIALVPTGTASARSWAAPEIRAVTSVGLMGSKSPPTFRPNATLTTQGLANLVFGLQQLLAPPPAPVTPPPAPAPSPTVTDTTQTTTEPTPMTTTVATTTTATTTTTTTTTAVTTTTTVAAPPPAPPAQPPKVANGSAAATMTMLDAQLVDGVGLGEAATEFAGGARAAGLDVPDRFGTEVAARLLGLRIDHPAREDAIELLPDDPATRAEAAYSAAQILHSSGWLVPVVQSLAD